MCKVRVLFSKSLLIFYELLTSVPHSADFEDIMCKQNIHPRLCLLSFETASLCQCHLWILRAQGGQCNTNTGLIGPIKSLCNTSQRSDSCHPSGSAYKDLYNSENSHQHHLSVAEKMNYEALRVCQ